MYKGNTVGVVIVAYNEEGFVGEVVDTLPSFVDRAYVVDDCSTDGTWAEIRRHARAENECRGDGTFSPPIVPVRHEENQGVGGAVKTGYRQAKADGLDVTVTMAGDGQMDPDVFDRIVDPVAEGEVDYAKGNRLLNSDHRRGMTGWRLFGNVLITALTRIASGYWSTFDPANGYTAISQRALCALDLDAVYEDYGSLNDVLVRLNVHDLRVADVAIPAVYGEESSGIRYSSFVPKLSWLLLRNFLWRLRVKYVSRGFHPLVAFYASGAVGGVAAVVGLTRSAVSDAADRRGSLLLFCLSVVLLGVAMLLDLVANRDLQRRFE